MLLSLYPHLRAIGGELVSAVLDGAAEGFTHSCRVGSHQQGIENDPDCCDDGTLAFTQQATE